MGYCKRCGDYFPTLTNSIDVCPRCACGMIPKPMTNADRIRTMDDSNLAIFLTQTAIQGCPYPAMDCEANCKECIQKWLQQPCEEGTV